MLDAGASGTGHRVLLWGLIRSPQKVWVTLRETTQKDDVHKMGKVAHGHFGARNIDHPPPPPARISHVGGSFNIPFRANLALIFLGDVSGGTFSKW